MVEIPWKDMLLLPNSMYSDKALKSDTVGNIHHDNQQIYKSMILRFPGEPVVKHLPSYHRSHPTENIFFC